MPKRKAKAAKRLSPADWENLPESEIMQLRIRDLGLQIQGSPLEEPIRRLYEELGEKGITFRPVCYLADEWFCPDKVPAIGIPFCLAHKRLKHIEEKMMYEVEGGTVSACMSLLRHECGHSINYAYALYRRTRWRELFGSFSTKYSNTYAFQPYSRKYVVHLKDNYAQAHPDEDFAETFAVWLTPGSRWDERYRGWPVMKKLGYVDHLMQSIGSKPPVVKGSITPWSAARMTSTLTTYYERKRKYLKEDFPGYYDSSLMRLFAPRNDPGEESASKFLRRHRGQVIDGVAAWTGKRKYDLHELLRKLIRRCEALDLCVNRTETETMVDLTAFVTAVTNRLLRFEPGRERG